MTCEVFSYQLLPGTLLLLQALCMGLAVVGAGLTALAEEEIDPAKHPMLHRLDPLAPVQVAQGSPVHS